MVDSFYTEEELKQFSFKKCGDNVRISRKVSIYGAEKISIGSNVRIDDFCILSGNITLGSNIHISAYCALYGSKGIVLEDYTGMSARSVIYSAMDDFNGEYLIGPVHDEKMTHVTGGLVTLKKFVQLGANSIVFPNLILSEGAVTGAFTLVTHNLSEWTVNVGIPSRILKKRKVIDLDRLEKDKNF